VRVIRRRKWLALVTLVVVPVTAVVLSLQQKPLYSATAEVLLNKQGLAASVTGVDPSAGQDPVRQLQTFADLAATPMVAKRVLDALHLRGRTTIQMLSASTITAKSDADLLVFTTRDPDPQMAVRIASEYARQFVRYRRRLDHIAFATARQHIRARLNGLDPTSALYSNLVQNEQRLDTIRGTPVVECGRRQGRDRFDESATASCPRRAAGLRTRT